MIVPPPLAFMCAGIGFCLMTHLTDIYTARGISIKSMVQSGSDQNGGPVTMTLMTHVATWAQLLPVLDQINAHEEVLAPVQALHVLSKGSAENG